jgi:hypothetical protein
MLNDDVHRQLGTLQGYEGLIAATLNPSETKGLSRQLRLGAWIRVGAGC